MRRRRAEGGGRKDAGVDRRGEKEVINKAEGRSQAKKYTDNSCSYLAAQRIATSAVEWPSELE